MENSIIEFETFKSNVEFIKFQQENNVNILVNTIRAHYTVACNLAEDSAGIFVAFIRLEENPIENITKFWETTDSDEVENIPNDYNYPCKECDNDVLIQLRQQPHVAECTKCGHPNDTPSLEDLEKYDTSK